MPFQCDSTTLAFSASRVGFSEPDAVNLFFSGKKTVQSLKRFQQNPLQSWCCLHSPQKGRGVRAPDCFFHLKVSASVMGWGRPFLAKLPQETNPDRSDPELSLNLVGLGHASSRCGLLFLSAALLAEVACGSALYQRGPRKMAMEAPLWAMFESDSLPATCASETKTALGSLRSASHLSPNVPQACPLTPTLPEPRRPSGALPKAFSLSPTLPADARSLGPTLPHTRPLSPTLPQRSAKKTKLASSESRSPTTWVRWLQELFQPLVAQRQQQRPLRIASLCSGMNTPSIGLQERRKNESGYEGSLRSNPPMHPLHLQQTSVLFLGLCKN